MTAARDGAPVQRMEVRHDGDHDGRRGPARGVHGPVRPGLRRRASAVPMVIIGDKLGLYKAMAGGEPVTPAELAERTGCRERYIREWLSQQAASGYVSYDAGDPHVPPAARAGAGARGRGQPRLHPGRVPAADGARARRAADPRAVPLRRRASAGTSTTTTCSRAPSGSSAPATSRNLVDAWLPALDGVVEKLADGRARGRHRLRARRVDDPDGAGVPAVTFVGLDYHEGRSRPRAAPPSAPGWRTASGSRSPPPRTSTAARTTSCACSTRCTTWATRSARRAHVRSQLADDGTWMVVEPFAGDALEDNLNPVGRVFYAGVDDALHAGVAVPGGRARARRPGRRGSG